jgi:hypothetical protein
MNWDDPGAWPGSVMWPSSGGTVEGVVTRMAVLPRSSFGRTESRLCIELDGDGVQRWANNRLWRTLGDARVMPGDRVRITRGPDEPNPSPGGKPFSTWTVERLQPTQPPAQAPQAGWGAQQGPAPAPSPWGAQQAPQQPPAAPAGPSW